MHLRRISYIIPLTCLIMTVSIVTYKVSSSAQKGTTTGLQDMTVVEHSGTKVQAQTPINNQVIRSDLSLTIAQKTTNHKFVYQGSQPYLLINDLHLIPLATNVYSGSWSNIYQVYDKPLVVYYEYIIPGARTYAYLYQLQRGSSRALDNVSLVGVVGRTSLFSLKQEDGGYRGLSALYDGELVTLYTGEYRTIQYLGDTLKLNNSQEIYLPLRTSGS